MVEDACALQCGSRCLILGQLGGVKEEGWDGGLHSRVSTSDYKHFSLEVGEVVWMEGHFGKCSMDCAVAGSAVDKAIDGEIVEANFTKL